MARASKQSYLLALGSNVPHHRHGAPRGVIAAALAELVAQGIAVDAVAPVTGSDPVGPSRRRYANSAAIVSTALLPEDLLAALQATEARFGRRRGRRWGARVLDLDIVLWDGGTWGSDLLTIPHPAFRSRDFVLRPAAAIAPQWRDPITGRTLRQLHARLTRPRPVPR